MPVYVQKRFVNATELDACNAIASAFKTRGSRVVYPLDLTYAGLIEHYMSSSSQASTCVAVPASPEDISAAIKIIGNRRIRFAVKGAGHASNQGFSSTPGIQFGMTNFKQVNLSGDKKTVDVGPLTSGTTSIRASRAPVLVSSWSCLWCRCRWLHHRRWWIQLQDQPVWCHGRHARLCRHCSSRRYHHDGFGLAEPDLFWAIKGGGNKFGIIYNFKLQTVPAGQIYGGVRTYTADQVDAVVNATLDFSENSKDPKASLLPTFNFLLGQPV